MKDAICQICAGQVRAYRHDWVFRCTGCGVLSSSLEVAIPVQPSKAHINETAREAGLAHLRRRNNEGLLGRLRAFGPPGNRLLDVGSGPGFLLAQAPNAGFEAQGIEPDPNVLEASRRYGTNVRQGFFPSILEADEAFDVIVFNDVLEHLPDLRRTLEASAQHLSPRGILCLNCPDKGGFFFRVAAIADRLGLPGPYERLWQRGLPSPHVWYFTPALLNQAAATAGLTPIGSMRLETIELRGLWSRIRLDPSVSIVAALAAYAFCIGLSPLLKLLPSDARACFYRKAA